MLPKLSGPIIERDYGTEPETVAEKETVLEMEVSAPQFLAGFKCAPAAEGDDYMRAAILGDMASDILLGESSPLYQRLYEQGLINPSFGGAFEMMPGVAYLYAGGDSKDARCRHRRHPEGGCPHRGGGRGRGLLPADPARHPSAPISGG